MSRVYDCVKKRKRSYAKINSPFDLPGLSKDKYFFDGYVRLLVEKEVVGQQI